MITHIRKDVFRLSAVTKNQPLQRFGPLAEILVRGVVSVLQILCGINSAGVPLSPVLSCEHSSSAGRPLPLPASSSAPTSGAHL